MELEPTEAQKKSGNYSKDHRYILGMRVSLENPAGSTRKGAAPDGTPWESQMAHDYGYIRGTTGRDRDHLDVFLGPDHKNGDLPVVVVDQHDPETGDFDEHKIMLGFEDAGSAMDAYHENYPEDWSGLGGIREMPLREFKAWAFGKGRRVKPAQHLKRGGLVKGYAEGGSVTADPAADTATAPEPPKPTDWYSAMVAEPGSHGTYRDPTTRKLYRADYTGPATVTGSGEDVTWTPGVNNKFNVTDEIKGAEYHEYSGAPYELMNGYGEHLGKGRIEKLKPRADYEKLGATYLAMILTMGAAGGAFAGLGLGGGGAGGAAAGAAAGGGGAGAAGSAAGFLGEGALSGIGAWDAALAAAPAWEGAAAAGAGAFNAAADSQLANVAIDAAGGDALAGYTAAGSGGVTASPIAGSNPLVDQLTKRVVNKAVSSAIDEIGGSPAPYRTPAARTAAATPAPAPAPMPRTSSPVDVNHYQWNSLNQGLGPGYNRFANGGHVRGALTRAIEQS
jgi:hypothetical protein